MRLINLLLWDMKFQGRYGFYLLYGILTAFYIVLLLSLPQSWKENAAAMLIYSDPAAMGLFFMGAIILLEKSQRVTPFFAVSPIRVWEYVCSKVISLSMLALLVGVPLAAVANLESLPFVLMGTFLASVLFALSGLIIATKITSLNQFILATVPVEIIALVPAILHLFDITPDFIRIYPGNVCMDMITGRSFSGMGLILTIVLIAVLFWGAFGCGKSTLLNVIATIDRPSSGGILLEGNDIAGMREQDLAAFRRDRLGFIFQEYNLLDTLTVGENIVLPLNLRKCSVRETSERLKKAAASLEITDQLSKFPRQLSGGQRQRAACARALITQPALILADEATGALDSANSRSLMQTFTFMNKTLGSTILMVTHDAAVGSYASRVLFLKDGRIWNELHRGDRTRQEMYHEILNTMAVLGGEADVR